MKTIIKINLSPLTNQVPSLIKTMEVFNSACNYISEIAYKEKCFSKFSLHKLVYYSVRTKFKLSAQLVVRAIAKVSDAYKINKTKLHKFKKFGSITYDSRILSFNKLCIIRQ